MAEKASRVGKTKSKEWNPSFGFRVDYNDHFETPLCAYRDVSLILDFMLRDRRANARLYDPYYCDGRTAVYLRSLGFEKVIHANRDFYKDIAAHRVPEHDVLITNPPYSENHKERCLEFCLKQFKELGRPFFLLIPHYVAAKSYYRRILGSSLQDMAYLIPPQPYEYDHPEGTGHDIPPFTSLWFCCIGQKMAQSVKKQWPTLVGSMSKSNAAPKFIDSLEELVDRGILSLDNRPNPKQRKKKRHNKGTTKGQLPQTNSCSHAKNGQPIKVKTPKKSSRYRDGDGKRKKKRF